MLLGENAATGRLLGKTHNFAGLFGGFFNILKITKNNLKSAQTPSLGIVLWL